MTIDKNILLNRIQEGEGLFQEFKRSLERIDRTIVAFANAKGGVIYIGLDDQGNVFPFPLTNRERARIYDIAKNIDPSIEVDCVDLGQITAIIVDEGEDKPYRCADGFFIRIGATCQKLTRNEIIDLATHVSRIRYEAMEELDFDYPGDFSEESLEGFVRVSHLEHVLATMGPENFLISMGVASKQAGRFIFNHAGILFFSKNPQRWIPQSKVSYARYQGTSKVHVIDRMIFGGTLPVQLEGVERRLSFDIPIGYRLADRTTREEVANYPLRALEEAVVNSLIHRDYYEDGAEIMIDHYADRIEISNPGELLGNMTVEKLGSKAIRRNPLISELFYRMGKGEKLGSGILRMQALMNEWKLKPPCFESSNGFFSVTFIGPLPPLSEEKLLLLPPRARQFVEMRNKITEPFTSHGYAEQFQITPRAAQKDIEILLARGIVLKEGKGRNTRYRFA